MLQLGEHGFGLPFRLLEPREKNSLKSSGCKHEPFLLPLLPRHYWTFLNHLLYADSLRQMGT
jgi:hypothetical protein